MNLRLALIAALLWLALPTSAQTQSSATITGRVVDAQGAPLPGVTISVMAGARDLNAVTDRQGRYTLDPVPSGTPTVRAVLPGFCSAERRVAVAPGGIATADFDLRPGPLSEIDWIAPPDNLADLVAKARIVAYVTVTAAVEPTAECDQFAEVRAAIIDQLKPAGQPPASLTFWQERWDSESKPYAVGTELVVFLEEWKGKLIRLHGPHAIFPIADGKVQLSPFLSYRSYVGVPVESLLGELRAMK